MIRSFSAAGDEQFAVLQEPQVAGAEERPFAGVASAGRGRCVRLPPAAASILGPRWARCTQTSPTRPGGQVAQRLGIDDDDFLVGQVVGRSRPGLARPRRPARRRSLRAGPAPAASKARTTGGSRDVSAGDDQRRLGQTETGDRTPRGGSRRVRRPRQRRRAFPPGPARPR